MRAAARTLGLIPLFLAAAVVAYVRTVAGEVRRMRA